MLRAEVELDLCFIRWWLSVSDDSEVPADDAGENPMAACSVALNARLHEAAGLIAACRKNKALISRYRSELRESSFLETLGISSRHSDASRAVEDAAAVVAAYALACELASSRTPTNAAVCKLLETVIKQAEMIEAAEQKLDEVLKGPAAPHARMLMEEAALRIAVGHLLPVKGKLPAFQRFAAQADRERLLDRPLSQGMLTRHVRGILDRARTSPPEPLSLTACVSAARLHGMSDDLEKKVTEFAERIPDMLWRMHTNKHLIKAARAALMSLRQYSKPSAYVVPPANLVLVCGALELFCAWQPGRRPKTTDDGKITLLVESLRIACFPDVEKWEVPRKTLLDVIGAWKEGRSAILFDGRDVTREKRHNLLRNVQTELYYGEDYIRNHDVDA